jgi:hypothetical protein
MLAASDPQRLGAGEQQQLMMWPIYIGLLAIILLLNNMDKNITAIRRKR